MCIKNKKKGYLFILDSIVALFVLTIGITLILSYRFPQPVTQQAEIYSSDLVSFLTKIKIQNLNDNYIGLNGVLVENGTITAVDNTLIEQTGEFYFRYSNSSCGGCLSFINDSMQSVTHSLFLKQFNFEIAVDDTVLKNRTVVYLNKAKPTKNTAELILPSRRFIYGIYNNTPYGPYIMEITVWQ